MLSDFQPCFSLNSLLFVLSLCTTEKSLAPSSLYTSVFVDFGKILSRLHAKQSQLSPPFPIGLLSSSLIIFEAIHVSGVLLAYSHSDHTSLLGHLPPLCQPRQCVGLSISRAKHCCCSPLIPSLFCLSTFLIWFCNMCKGVTVQEGAGRINQCGSAFVWQYSSSSSSLDI